MIQPFDLNLRHLRAVPLIVRHGNMSAAAAAASLSQPALTQGIAKLEGQLGVRLFERRPDGMTATAQGQAFARRVDTALAHLGAFARAGGRGFARPDRLMTVTQLRAFLALVDAGSFAEAARSACWSQPAIHRAVRDLEQIGGLRLAERRGRGVVLTPDGRRLARAARLMRSELAAAFEDLSPDASERGRLVVGAMPLCRARLLPTAIAALIRSAPRATVDIVDGSWRELVEPLRDGQIDMMIGALREDPAPVDIAQEPLLVDRLAVVARAGHPLAGTAPRLDELAAFSWVVGRFGTPLRGHWQEMFDGCDAPHAPIECGSAMTIRGILLDSDYLTLLSHDQVAMEVDAGLLTLIDPPAPSITRTIGIATRAGWQPTFLQLRLIEILRDAVRAEFAKTYRLSSDPIGSGVY